MADTQAHNIQTSPYYGMRNRTKLCQTVRGISTWPASYKNNCIQDTHFPDKDIKKEKSSGIFHML